LASYSILYSAKSHKKIVDLADYDILYAAKSHKKIADLAGYMILEFLICCKAREINNL